MKRSMRGLALAYVIPSLIACGRSGGDGSHASPLLHDPGAAKVSVDVGAAVKDPAGLATALALRHRDTARRLGAHRFHGTHAVTVTEDGKEIETLTEETSIELTAGGDLHALYKNSKDYGREAFSVAGTIWVRPLFGKFHRRPPTAPEEADEIADEIYGTFGADIDLCASEIAFAGPAEATTVAGRPAERVRLQKGPARPRPPQSAPEKAWRDTVSVDSLTGEVALDRETGALLAGTLTARVSFARAGQRFSMDLKATHEISDVGGAVAVAAPAEGDSVGTPENSSEFDERHELLEGLAPPPRRAPTPDPGARGAQGHAPTGPASAPGSSH